MRVDEALAELHAAAEMLRAEHPDLANDDVAWVDTLQGCTSGIELAEMLAEKALHLSALEAIASERARVLNARARRFAEQEAKLRNIVLALVDAAGGKKIVLAAVTLSPRNTPVKLVAIDPAATPPDYLKVVTTAEPDKKAIREALDLGAQIDGWALSNGGRSLSIHVR